MAILDALRAGIKAADGITKSLQSSVQLSRVVVSTDGYQTRSYASPTTLKAIVDYKKMSNKTATGISIVMAPTVQFLDVAALVAATAGVGISIEDQITLPDGSVKVVTAVSGYLDPGTGRPVATTAVF